MSPKRTFRRRVFLILAVICLLGETFLYLDSFYLRGARIVGNARDPRWRVIDFNSRPASESEIYDVAEVPVVHKVSVVGPRRLRFEFAPAIRATGWTVYEGSERTIVAQGHFPEIPFPETLHDGAATALEKSEAVFRFVMSELKDSGGSPSDAVQSASPLETYRLLKSGRGKGFCENKALVYFLFANAAGVTTRLVDLAGKFGPLKLSGHYFCESFILEEGSWAYVDPQSGIANIRDGHGGLVNTIELQRLLKTAAFETCVLRTYDPSPDAIVSSRAEGRAGSLENYFTGDGVLAFPFGYENKPGLTRVWHFLTRSTLLYARFTLPKIYLWKYVFLFGFVISAVLAAARRGGRSPKP